MVDVASQAEDAVKSLLQADETQLYEQLGIRAKAIARDPAAGASFAPVVTYDQAEMGLKEDVREFGQRLYRRWRVETYKLLCSSTPEDQQDRQQFASAFGISDVAVASMLSALLVTQLGVAPALAAVVAALLVKRYFRPSYEEFCQVWQGHLGDSVK